MATMTAQHVLDGNMSLRGWSNVKDIIPRIHAAVKDRERQSAEQRKRRARELVEDEQETRPKKRARLEEDAGLEEDTFKTAALPVVPIDLSTADNCLMREEMLNLCKEGLLSKIHPEHFSYPGGLAGDPELLASLATFFNDYFSPANPVQDSHLMVGAGAAGCLDALIYNVCDAGDGILVPSPCWNAFDFILRARTAINLLNVVVEDASPEQSLTTALMDALDRTMAGATCKVKALLLVNPNNPLGQCYPREVLEECVKFCEKHDIHFISDEIYALTSYRAHDLPAPNPFISAISLDLAALGCDPKRVHMIWSTSKDLGQNGLRMGCLVSQANEGVRTGAALWSTATVSSFTAAAVAHVLRSPRLKDILKTSSERLSSAYTSMTDMLRRNGIDYVPANAGLFVFARLAPDATTWEDESEVVQQLKEAGVIVSGGRGYHTADLAKGWARVGFALPKDQLQEAVSRMDEYFSTRARKAGKSPSSLATK